MEESLKLYIKSLIILANEVKQKLPNLYTYDDLLEYDLNRSYKCKRSKVYMRSGFYPMFKILLDGLIQEVNILAKGISISEELLARRSEQTNTHYFSALFNVLWCDKFNKFENIFYKKNEYMEKFYNAMNKLKFVNENAKKIVISCIDSFIRYFVVIHTDVIQGPSLMTKNMQYVINILNLHCQLHKKKGLYLPLMKG